MKKKQQIQVKDIAYGWIKVKNKNLFKNRNHEIYSVSTMGENCLQNRQ